MKTTVATIMSLACAFARALPIPEDRATSDTGVNNLFSDANSLFGGLTTDVNGLLGSIENQLEARSKRGLFLSKTQLNAAGLLTDLSSAADVKAVLDSAGLEAGDERLGSLLGELGGNNVDEVIEDASNTITARSLDEECEDVTDFPGGEGTTDPSESDDNSTLDSSSDVVNDTEGAVSEDSDDGSLVADSSLTANDVENGVSAEGGDQTDLSKRTIALGSGNLNAALAHLEYDLTTKGPALNIDVSKIADTVVTA